MRRTLVSSEQSLDGKLFVQFIALIYLSWITGKIQENNLFKDNTMQSVLDEFDVIECFEIPVRRLQIGDLTKRQDELYSDSVEVWYNPISVSDGKLTLDYRFED